MKKRDEAKRERIVTIFRFCRAKSCASEAAGLFSADARRRHNRDMLSPRITHPHTLSRRLAVTHSTTPTVTLTTNHSDGRGE
jgi:hypothetical protein